jgi:amidase
MSTGAHHKVDQAHASEEISALADCSRRGFLRAGAATLAIASAQPAPSLFSVSTVQIAETLPFATALEAARAIRSRSISSAELTGHILERIERYNPKINAIVIVTAESALALAKAADEALARGDWWGPFHGVPVTVKDTFEVAGVRTTAGSPDLANYVPTRDAPLVGRLRRSGAVIVGKTNVPLFAADMQTFNKVFGTTNNPWNTALSPGGSTGGGAAALAAGLGYVTLGSDIGGSIRNPAHFCGVYGHKPTYDVLPTTGELASLPDRQPYAPDELSVSGVLARGAADLRAAVEALGGPEAEDATAYRWRLPQPRGLRLQDYRIGYVLDHPLCPVVPEVKECLQSAIDALRKAGARLEEGWPDGVAPAEQYATYGYLLMASFADNAAEEDAESFRQLAASQEQNWLTLRARAWTDPHAGFQAARREQLLHRAAWQRYFETRDAFLLPAAFTPAFPHVQTEPLELRTIETSLGRRSYLDLLFWISFATLTGLPGTVAPTGLTDRGLPSGIQIIGPYLEDATPIAIAGHLADAIGGFRAPTGY